MAISLRQLTNAGLLWVTLALPIGAAADDLLTLYREVLTGSPQLRARDFATTRARADAGVADSRLYPQVSLQMSASRNDYRDTATGIRYSGNRSTLSARQALIDMPSVYRARGARVAITQAEQDAEQARADLVAQLVDQYLNALQAQDELVQLQVEREAAQRQVDRLRAMREREMAKVTDLAEAIAWLQQLATREIDAHNKADAARVRVGELTGRIPATLAPLALQEFPVVPRDANDWVDSALAQNAQLGARRAEVDATRLAAEAARAEHWPQLALTLTRNQSNQDIDNSPRRDFAVNSIGLELRIPIYEGGRTSAAAESASAQLAVASEQFEAVRRQIERETRLLFDSARANRDRIDSTNAEVDALSYTVKAQQRGYELGAVTVIQVLDARRRLLRSRVDQAKARYDYLRDLIGLRLRAGGLSESDIGEFNSWFGTAPGAAGQVSLSMSEGNQAR